MAKPKATSKVMDVVHPSGNRRPSPTSRPVILPDRSYMAADPMLSVTDAKDKNAVLPPSDKKELPKLNGAPELDEKTQATDLEAESTTTDLKPLNPEKPELLTVDEPKTTDTSDTPDTPDAPDTLVTPVATDIPDALEDPEIPKTEETPEVAASVPDSSPGAIAASITTPEHVDTTPPESSDTPEGDESDSESDADTPETDAEPSEDAAQTQPAQNPDDAALKAREEELERHIAAGTYAVPINMVKRRRTRVLFVVVFVVLILIIAVDLLADMGTITLPLGLPHTNFLAH